MSTAIEASPPESALTAETVEALYVPKELWLAAFLAAVLGYFLFSENGAVLAQQWEYLHEFFHDGRHVFGVPCH